MEMLGGYVRGEPLRRHGIDTEIQDGSTALEGRRVCRKPFAVAIVTIVGIKETFWP